MARHVASKQLLDCLESTLHMHNCTGAVLSLVVSLTVIRTWWILGFWVNKGFTLRTSDLDWA